MAGERVWMIPSFVNRKTIQESGDARRYFISRILLFAVHHLKDPSNSNAEIQELYSKERSGKRVIPSTKRKTQSCKYQGKLD